MSATNSHSPTVVAAAAPKASATRRRRSTRRRRAPPVRAGRRFPTGAMRRRRRSGRAGRGRRHSGGGGRTPRARRPRRRRRQIAENGDRGVGNRKHVVRRRHHDQPAHGVRARARRCLKRNANELKERADEPERERIVFVVVGARLFELHLLVRAQRARRRALLRGALLFRRHPVWLGRARRRPPPHRRRGARADADAARTRDSQPFLDLSWIELD